MEQSFFLQEWWLDIYITSKRYYPKYMHRRQAGAIWWCTQVVPTGYKTDYGYGSLLRWLLGGPRILYFKHWDTIPLAKIWCLFSEWGRNYGYPVSIQKTFTSPSSVNCKWRVQYIGLYPGDVQDCFIAEIGEDCSEITLLVLDLHTECLGTLAPNQHQSLDEDVCNFSADAEVL